MKHPSCALPVYPRAACEAKRLPSWPASSIVLSLILALILPPGILTGMNLYLLLLAFVLWMSSGEPFDSCLLKAIAPFFMILAVGLVAGIGADRYLYLKDAWYILNPIVVISVGYVFYRCKPDVARGLRAFVVGGTLVATVFLSAFVDRPDLILQSAVRIRETVGTGYYAPALAFTILIGFFGKWRKGLELPNWIATLCLFICSLAVILCFSRTMLIVAIIGVMTVLGAFARREWQRIAVIAISGTVLVSGLNLLVDTSSREVQHTFIGKLARSLEEITVDDYTDLKSINENWRGYETSRALDAYAAGAPHQWLVGQGFGAEVDLGIAMPLGGGVGEQRVLKRFIPILHNGYAYLLVKGGAFALLLFGYFLFWLYWLGRQGANAQPDRFSALPARLLQAVALNLAVTTWIVSGAFNKLDMFPYLLAAGFLLGATDRPEGGRK